MQIIHTSSGHRPPEIDEVSSPTTVYTRCNIVEFNIQDEEGHDMTWWKYDEFQYSREEWEELQVAKYVVDLEFRLLLLETQGGII